jgi:acyl-CoA reductase-like NAD-dependent aldehyde dehydrogenase
MNTTLNSAAVTTVDPATGKQLETYPVNDAASIDAALTAATAAFRSWRATSHDERSSALRAVSARLRARKSELATLATHEMGKTIGEAEAEVEKCAVGCDHYAEHGARYLADEIVATNAAKSYVGFRPLGVLLAIMPWNFPFWQVFRAAAPALAAGNVVVLKHAANVTGCALAIERIFRGPHRRRSARCGRHPHGQRRRRQRGRGHRGERTQEDGTRTRRLGRVHRTCRRRYRSGGEDGRARALPE